MATQETGPALAVSSPAGADERIRVSQHKSHTRVSLAGALDLTGVEALHAALIALVDSAKDVVIDCADAEHVSSAALQVLIAADVTLARSGRRVRIEAETAAIRDYLKLAGLDQRFPAADTATPGKRKRSGQVSTQP